MELILIPLAKSRAMSIIVKDRKTQKTWEEIALQGDDIVRALDKIFRIAKINITSLDKIFVLAQKDSSLISFFLAKTVKQSLGIAKSFKPS